LFIKAVALFHLKSFREASESFNRADENSDFSSIGDHRLIRSYVFSDENGSRITFSGTAKNTYQAEDKNAKGFVYIAELDYDIPFFLKEFNLPSIERGKRLDDFYIGFNFRGPIAISNSRK
jgi:hypothetical protein